MYRARREHFSESILGAIAVPQTSRHEHKPRGCYRDSNCCLQLFARRRLRGREIDHGFCLVTLENIYLAVKTNFSSNKSYFLHTRMFTSYLTFHFNHRNKLLSIIMSIVRRVIHCGGHPYIYAPQRARPHS